MSDYDLKKHVDDLVDHVAALKEQTASMVGGGMHWLGGGWAVVVMVLTWLHSLDRNSHLSPSNPN